MEVLSWHLNETRKPPKKPQSEQMVSGMSQIQSRGAIQATKKLSMMWKNCHNFNITLLKTLLLNHVTQSVAAEV
jgi:hypothetical protein